MTGSDISTALAIATPMTLLSTLIETGADILRISMTHMIDSSVEAGNFKRAKTINIVWGPMLYSICYFIPVFIAVYFGADLINLINDFIPEFVLNGVTLGANLVAFFGFAMLLSVIINKKNAIFFFFGFALAAYSGLSLTGIAIIAIIFAVILYQLKYDNNSKVQTADGSIDELDELDD